MRTADRELEELMVVLQVTYRVVFYLQLHSNGIERRSRLG